MMNSTTNPTEALSLIALLLALLPAITPRWPQSFAVVAAFALVQTFVAYRLSVELNAPAGRLIVPAALIVPPMVLAIVIAARVTTEAGIVLWRAWSPRPLRPGFARRIALYPAPLAFADDAA